MLDGAKWGNKHHRVGNRAVQYSLELLKKLMCFSAFWCYCCKICSQKEKMKLNISSYDINLHSLEIFCWHCGREVGVSLSRKGKDSCRAGGGMRGVSLN